MIGQKARSAEIFLEFLDFPFLLLNLLWRVCCIFVLFECIALILMTFCPVSHKFGYGLDTRGTKTKTAAIAPQHIPPPRYVSKSPHGLSRLFALCVQLRVSWVLAVFGLSRYTLILNASAASKFVVNAIIWNYREHYKWLPQ